MTMHADFHACAVMSSPHTCTVTALVESGMGASDTCSGNIVMSGMQSSLTSGSMQCLVLPAMAHVDVSLAFSCAGLASSCAGEGIAQPA